VLIKPDGVRKGLIGEIIKRFEQRDLKIVALEMFQPSFKEMDDHYPKDEKWISRSASAPLQPTQNMVTTLNEILAHRFDEDREDSAQLACGLYVLSTDGKDGCAGSTCSRHGPQNCLAQRCRILQRWVLSVAIILQTLLLVPISKVARSLTSSTPQKLLRKLSTK
jgi:hypothetical protein